MSIDGPSRQPDEEPDRPREGPRPGEPADHRGSVEAQPETRTRQEYYDVLASGGGNEIVGFAALMAERPASERHEWQIPLSQGEVDRCGLGVIDERAKTFSAAERRIAEHLATPGPAVVSVSEGFGIYGRTADARVNGISVEFKSLDPGASDRTVKAALNSAKGQARDADLMHLMEQTLGGTFTFDEGTDPYIRVGTVAVYVGEHDFDDDDIAWPGGSDVPLRSMYPAMIEFRDTGGDQQRQQAIAGQVLAALESAGRRPAVYIDDMQKVLDSYQPPGNGSFPAR